jgi:acylglycerol lipase
MFAMEFDTNTLTTLDGHALHIQSWHPATTMAKIVITHGYAEHGGRYETFAKTLVELGYAVYAWDLRGHGRSTGQRCLVQDFAEYVGDLQLVIDYAVDEVAVPIFLMGHSMGGTISTLYAMQSAKIALRGLILSAPFLQQPGREDSPGFVKSINILSRFWPTMPTFKIDSSKISRDSLVVAAYDRDPLVFHGRSPVCTVAAIFRAMGQIRAGCHQIELPLLILHGGLDGLADPAGSDRLMASVGSIDKTHKVYPDCYHELFNEPEKDQVWSDFLTWLQAH